nr:hypothetical protein [Physocyclus mexicanus]
MLSQNALKILAKEACGKFLCWKKNSRWIQDDDNKGAQRSKPL